MKITCMKPTFTPDGLFMQYHALVCSLPLSFCGLSVRREKKQLKTTSQDLNKSTKTNRVTVPVCDFKCNDDTTAYHKDEHQNWIVRPRGVKLRFISVNHIFIILLRSEKKSYNQSYAPICLNCICYLFCLICCKFSFSYCLWLYCLCLGPPRTNDESKATTKSKGKKICHISNKWVGKCSSDMLPIYICPCTAAVKMRTVNVCTCLITRIISFLTVKELLDTVLTINNEVKYVLELIWVEAYLLPVTENLWNQDVTLHIHLVKIVYYNDWLLYSFFFNKVHKSIP